MTEQPDKPKKVRANYLPAPHFFRLNHACLVVNRAFDDTCYLVGSCLDRPDYRDVDVRLILDDEAFDKLFHAHGTSHDALWSLLCVTISAWLGQQSGLAIDFQIQRRTQANAEHPKGKRWALGVFLDYPGERPSEIGECAPCAPSVANEAADRNRPEHSEGTPDAALTPPEALK